ncbi:iron ABC transporter permease [Staphylococcus simiae]|uniref:FecCD family ABC transporter permease n=1 Tax=Staphylococcus simiae TaxID=308354 RepID=UPI001A977A91|nr:iron ABC transporter permease [Staphylococcus simiae]MBO1199582.1 iron ABC transporter permease [Staphylococcus simiae]MBO1201616.1 iron ABC transporter permease [Staphylococcus simiae]MBO1203736.1 iron ABC transporter permease [Staphylococcus simiae]MBO1211615.1 iron ABC transporter permease [Staphylococcus simiae]MBO1230001.1 iron ABC transporter permease [Staphylococcus simiae]
MTFHKVLVIWLVLLGIASLSSLFWNIGDINDSFNQSILLNVRVPRLLEAMLTGMILALAGLIFQTILNNPLADSFTLGLASGATFGSGLSLFLGLGLLWQPVMSIFFSLLSLFVVLICSSMISKGYPIRILILAGLMVGALFNALLYFLILLKPRQLNSIANYLFGGFGDAEYSHVWMIASALFLALVIFIVLLNSIKLLQLGEMKSQSLGLNVQLISFMALTVASMMTAINVAYVGIIGFVGMIIPQLIRRYFARLTLGQQMTLNLVIGATMLTIADFIGSNIVAPIQIPASIIIALIGIPILFHLLISQTKLLH